MPTPGDTICGEILLEHLAPASLGAEVFQPVFVARHLGRDEMLWLTIVDGMFTPTSVELSAFMAGANGLMPVRHPSLVRVVLVDREEDYCVVGYERLVGAEPLSDLVVRGDSRRVLARAAVEVARGLACLHRRGLLHGALTPGTVLLWEGAPVLWEHGLAALCDPAVLGPRSRSLGGDAVAPEVPSGAPLTPTADVYAWGAVMAAIASGLLGSEAVAAVLEGDVDPGRHGLLLGVVRQALAPEPGRRPRDGVHLLELLQRALASVDPNTELEPSERVTQGGDDVLRELASRYLAEVDGLEKAAAARSARPSVVGPPPPMGAAMGPPTGASGALGRIALVKPGEGTPRVPIPPVVERGSGGGRVSSAHHPTLQGMPGAEVPGAVRGPAPGGAGVDAGSLTIGPAESSARWAATAPEASASGWLRPGTPRAADGGKGGLFDKKKPYVEIDYGVRKRSIVSAAAANAPRPPEHAPPRRTGVPRVLDEDDTPPEATPIVPEHRGEHRVDHRGLLELELLGDIPQSERETPYDVAIVTPLPPRTPPPSGRESRRDRERRREREQGRPAEPEPEIEPDLPDILEEHELPPMPDAEDRPEPGAAASSMSGPARSSVREPFRVPRTPGPHGPPAALMAGVLALLCGVVALGATLTAASARGGLGRMLAGDPTTAPADGGAGEGAEADVGADAGPCPPGMVEVHAEPQSFCIDRAEYPGVDQPPALDVDHAHAKQACAVRSHALCTTVQWQRACRGASDWTYPYGPKREAGRCRVGDETAAPGPGGADPHCVTPEGVLDLVGNVAEWTAEGDVLGGSVRSPKGSGCDTKQRQKPKSTSPVVGFRCCAPLPAGSGGG